eukprot:1197546-Rhodomonas_salina.3
MHRMSHASVNEIVPLLPGTAHTQKAERHFAKRAFSAAVFTVSRECKSRPGWLQIRRLRALQPWPGSRALLCGTTPRCAGACLQVATQQQLSHFRKPPRERAGDATFHHRLGVVRKLARRPARVVLAVLNEVADCALQHVASERTCESKRDKRASVRASVSHAGTRQTARAARGTNTILDRAVGGEGVGGAGTEEVDSAREGLHEPAVRVKEAPDHVVLDQERHRAVVRSVVHLPLLSRVPVCSSPHPINISLPLLLCFLANASHAASARRSLQRCLERDW